MDYIVVDIKITWGVDHDTFCIMFSLASYLAFSVVSNKMRGAPKRYFAYRPRGVITQVSG